MANTVGLLFQHAVNSSTLVYVAISYMGAGLVLRIDSKALNANLINVFMFPLK